jgi:predicted phosphoribosyltransferase
MLDSRVFPDRSAAGRELAGAVLKLRLRLPVLVLGLPRGGVPVAYEVARALHAPLDVLVVRKIGMPGQPELAIGAIASGDVIVREADSASFMAGLDMPFEQIAKRERVELERREQAYRAGLPPLDLRGRTVVLVDDGLATGATMVAAVRAARKAGAASVVVAAPVASDSAVALVGAEADQLAILEIPAFLLSIGAWYANFEQIEDAEVCTLLERGRRTEPVTVPPSKGGV